MQSFDVVVVGGGSAGVSAALAAARGGCSTLLLERSPRLGGNVAHGLVHTICGLYKLAEGDLPQLANGGIAAEFARRLTLNGGAHGPVRMGRLDVLLHEPEEFSNLCHRLVEEEPRITFWKEVSCEESEVRDNRITSLNLQDPRKQIRADCFIDATGDASFAQLCGAEIEKTPARHLQRPAYIFGVTRVEEKALEHEPRLRMIRILSRAIRDGHIPASLAGASIRETCIRGNARVTIDLGAYGEAYDPFNEAQLKAVHAEAKNLARLFVDFLRTSVPGFERAEIFESPSRLGIRESARITGLYQLTAADILECADFEDGVCVSTWPIEMRETSKGPRFRYPSKSKGCQIPLRALLSRNISNLVSAGRCISSTHEAHAALRVIGTGLAMGEAAGLTAAAIATNRHLDLSGTTLTELAAAILKKTGTASASA